MNKPTEVRNHVLANLDHYLAELDKELTAHGGKVVYLRDVDEAADYIELLARERDLPVSSGAENLRQVLEQLEPGIEAYLRGGPREAPGNVAIAEGEIGISSAAYLIAEAGAVCLAGGAVAGPGPRVQVVVAGIDRVLPRMRDLAVFLPLHGEGDVRLLAGPRRAGEVDGPEEFYLLLVDGGRTALLADEAKRTLLRCIRCGECLAARQEVKCPVEIDLAMVPLLLRAESAPEAVTGWKFRLWGVLMRNPRLYEFAGHMLRAFWREEWGLPAPPAKTFRQEWREGRKP
jgi:hypothetical protein